MGILGCVEKKGSLAGVSVIAAGFLLMVLVLFVLAEPAAASAPGDKYVFGADSPLALSHDYQQQHPETSGNIAVWDDARPGGGFGNPMRIFYKDLTKSDPEKPLVEKPGTGLKQDGEFSPAIDGDLVAWLVGSIPGNTIHFMVLGNGCPGGSGCDQALVIPEARPVSLAVSGHRIVWDDVRGGYAQNNIYMFDLDNPDVGAQPLVTLPGEDISPDIDGDWLAWIHNDSYVLGVPKGNDVFAKNLATGEVRQITFDAGTALQQQPSISGARISWWVSGPTGSYAMDNRVFVYDLVSGSTQAIPQSDHADSDNIDGNIVVWCQFSTGRLLMNNLATGITQAVSDGGVHLHNPNVSAISGYILWQDSRLGAKTIFKNRIGDTAQQLANKYKPELKMSRDENFWPMPVEQMLTAPGTFLRKRNDPAFTPLQNPSVHDLATKASGLDFYVDLAGDSVAAGGGDPSISIDHSLVNRLYAVPYRERKDQFPARIYARVVSRPAGNSHSFIQYWFLYYANDYPELFHEGDWEVVQVDLDGNLEPYRADISQHGGGRWRNWTGPGSAERTGDNSTHPVVYVAQGSHANYFKAGDYSNFIKSWDAAHGDGVILNGTNDPSAPNTDAEVVPEPADAGNSQFEWLQFPGQWGEFTGANVGIWPALFGGERDGADNPPVQGYWKYGFSWPNETCDGCEDQSAQGTDTEVTALSSVDLNLYDSQGRHTGKNPDGSIDEQIPDSEYLEYPEMHRKSVIIHGGDVSAGYRMEAKGTGTGAADLIVTAPNHGSGQVDTLNYDNIQVNPATMISMTLDASRKFTASIDTYGSGAGMIEKAPDATATKIVDFTPPARISDLAITSAGPGTATVSFTAPGDDGNTGAATTYDLRYSTSAISDQYWNDATPAGGLPAPLPAGSRQSITVSGLDDHATYHFAVKAMDDAGLFSPLSNDAAVSMAAPDLTWSLEKAHWSGFNDYENRVLSVDYRLLNSGPGVARTPTLYSSVSNLSEVHTVTPLPLSLPDLAAQKWNLVTIKYHVPAGVDSFMTLTSAYCRDDAGRTYWFPGPATN